MPIFSEVASAWISTMTALAAPPRGAVFRAASSAENGSSKGRFMNTRPSAVATKTLRPRVASNSPEPRPGAPLGVVQRAQDAGLALDMGQHLLLVEGVVAERDAVGPGGK